MTPDINLLLRKEFWHKIFMSLVATVLLISSSSAQAELSNEFQKYILQYETAIEARNYDNASSIAERMLRTARAKGDSAAIIMGTSLKVSALLSIHDTIPLTKDIDLLKNIYESLKKRGDAELAGNVARTLGRYYHFSENAFSLSLQYYLEALEHHRHTGDKQQEIKDLSSIAVLYLHKEDAAGWDYAMNAYSLAKSTDNQPALYITSCNLGNYLFNRGDYDGAINYYNKAREIAKALHYDMEKSYLSTFTARIYEKQGKEKAAENSYREAIDSDSLASPYDRIYSRIQFGQFLNKTGRNAEAVKILKDTEELADSLSLETFKIQILPLLSDSYEKIGNYKEALSYHKQYLQESNRLFSEEKEKEFSILDLRYKVAEEKRRNAAQSLVIMKRKRISEVIGGIAVFLLVVAVVLFIYHRKRMSDYKTIVRGHLLNLESERKLKEKYEQKIALMNSEPKKETVQSNDRLSEIFTRFEAMMTDEKIYRRQDLSLDKVASMLGTNRTYLSQVVNERAGSFSSYVTSFRLKEAVDLLSDPDNNDSLKGIALSAGFASPSSFYTIFRQKYGVSPSVFRSNVRSLANEEGRR